MYQEYLAEFWYSAKALENSKVSFSIPTGGIYGEVGLNTFRNAIGTHYLPHSSEYVAPPSIDIVRKWFPMIGYGEEVSTKGTLRKSLLPPRWRLVMAQIIQCLGEDIILKLKKKQRENVVPYTQFISLLIMHKMKEGYGDDEVTQYPTHVFSVNNWTLKPNQLEELFFTDHMLAICNAKEPVALKAPKPSSIAERVPQGGSSKTPTGSKTSHSKRRKESSSAMDSNLSRPSVSTPMDTEMHKEDQQATSGRTSLGVTSEERANPQLSSGHDASPDSTAEDDPGLSAPNDSIPSQQGMDEGIKNTSYDHIFAEKKEASTAINGDKEEASSTIKLEDLAKLVSQIHPSFKDLDSPKDDLVIIIDESDEDEPNAKTEDTSVPKSLSPSNSLPTELKDLPSKFNELTGEIKGLKTQVHELEIELPNELKEIPTKLEDFRKTTTSLTSQVTEQDYYQSYISTQAKLKTLDALPSLLLNVTKAMNKFAEKDTNQATISQLFQRRADKIAEALLGWGFGLSASGHDASPDSTAEADPGLSAPNDSIPPQQGMDEGIKNTSYDHIFAEKGASSTAINGDKEEAFSIIKLEDLAKLVSQIHPSFMDLDSPEDDLVIIIDESDEDEPNAETEDTSVPKSLSPKSSQIQELTNLVLILQSKKHQLELEKNKAEAEAALLKAQPSFPNELPEEFLSLPAKVESAQAKLKTLDALPSLLLNVTKAMNKFAEILESSSTKAGDQSVPSAGQADTMPAEGEKDTNQATISQLFQRRADKIAEAEKENLNQQPKQTTLPTTTPINPPIITTTTHMQTVTPRQGKNKRRNFMDIITAQWCQQ
ncbi:hypothetical protein Tco_0464760 [Tanacetum coccineum]